MSRDWAKEGEGLITVNLMAYSVASIFILSLRLFLTKGEVLRWKGKLLRVVVGKHQEPGHGRGQSALGVNTILGFAKAVCTHGGRGHLQVSSVP